MAQRKMGEVRLPGITYLFFYIVINKIIKMLGVAA